HVGWKRRARNSLDSRRIVVSVAIRRLHHHLPRIPLREPFQLALQAGNDLPNPVEIAQRLALALVDDVPVAQMKLVLQPDHASLADLHRPLLARPLMRTTGAGAHPVQTGSVLQVPTLHVRRTRKTPAASLPPGLLIQPACTLLRTSVRPELGVDHVFLLGAA